MATLLVIEDEPFFLGISDWGRFSLPEGSSWDLVSHPDEIPKDLSKYDGFLLDHRMATRKGDEVAAELITRGIHPSKILRISSLREGQYPEGVEWVGKRLRPNAVRQIFQFFSGKSDLDSVLSAIHYH